MHIVFRAFIALATIKAAQAQPYSASCTSSAILQPAATANAGEQLSRDLLSAPTAIKRFQRLLVHDDKLLTGDALRKRTVFDFNGAQPANGARGGAAKAADVESFQFLTHLGISMTLGFLEPCGINTPHMHPRATEFLVLVEGSNLRFGQVLEDGLVKSGQDQEIAGTLKRYQGTAFPPGSTHYQFNDSCEKAVFVAALNSEDPGTSRIAQNFFSLDPGVVNATLGYPRIVNGDDVKDFKKTIPDNLAQDVNVCLARCRSS